MKRIERIVKRVDRFLDLMERGVAALDKLAVAVEKQQDFKPIQFNPPLPIFPDIPYPPAPPPRDWLEPDHPDLGPYIQWDTTRTTGSAPL